MTHKWHYAVAVLFLSSATAQIVKRSDQFPNVQEELGVTIAMRDGIRLAADVFRPRMAGRWPTILVRTPYNRKSPAMNSYRSFARQGYAVVIEDVRGRFASQGSVGSIEQEGPDGSDTITWVAVQPWSNGRVAMVGASYLGIVQWWAAIQDNPHLATIAPVNSGDDEYLDRFYSSGGALKLGHRLLWLAQNFTAPSRLRPQFGSYIFHLPLRTADIAAIGVASHIWQTALDHPSYDTFWKDLSIRESLGNVRIPVLSMSGWFDNYSESELNAFTTLSRQGDTVETWIGPWSHVPNMKFPSRDFGPDSELHIRATQAEWFDRWLKTTPLPEDRRRPLLHLFIMGPNVWREEHEWPIARTRFTPLFLASKGRANSAAGNGELVWREPRPRSPSDTFTYDPSNPVPTMGGAICCDPKVLPPGPLDQTPVERRNDVLVYTSAPLSDELEVTGPVRVKLFVSTSANDTDFTAKLVDVDRTGRPLLVCDGIRRMRYRLSLEKPVFVKRGSTYEISVDAGVTSYVFEPGHRIRLEVSSSNFPRFDRNLNSTGPNADQWEIVKAKQAVYHDRHYPSAIVLPLIPRSIQRDSDRTGNNQHTAYRLTPR